MLPLLGSLIQTNRMLCMDLILQNIDVKCVFSELSPTKTIEASCFMPQVLIDLNPPHQMF